MPLKEWGWDDAWAAMLGPEVERVPARVTAQDRELWSVQTETGAARARVRGPASDFPPPVVGDWVLVERGAAAGDPWFIVDVLPRRSRFSRAAAGDGAAEQVLAANIDRLWIVQGLDVPVNLRRLERYLALAWESGAVPEIVLTKSDLVPDPGAALASVATVALGVPVRVVSSIDPVSITALRGTLKAGHTVALLGPSGVGKSTLLNLLAGVELAETGSVREADRKGRHTTTRRSLFRIPGGALLLDTPGIRELRVWNLDEGLDQAFPDIADLSAQCRFRDCGHESEPGCAVREAVERGALDADRLASFHKLRAEAAYQVRKIDPRARAAAVAEHRTAMKTLKYHPKYRRED